MFRSLIVQMMEIHRNNLAYVVAATLVVSILIVLVAWKLLGTFLLGTGEIFGSLDFSDKTSSGWFLAHPLLAILGTVALPVPGLLVRKFKGYWSKKVHAFLFSSAVSALLASLFIIYASKEAKNKPHLQSYHGIFGALLTLGYVGMAMIGSMALDPDTSFIREKHIRSWMKWIHKSGGRILLVAGYWICLTGWYKFFPGAESIVGAMVAGLATFLTFLRVPVMDKKDDKLLS